MTANFPKKYWTISLFSVMWLFSYMLEKISNSMGDHGPSRLIEIAFVSKIFTCLLNRTFWLKPWLKFFKLTIYDRKLLLSSELKLTTYLSRLRVILRLIYSWARVLECHFLVDILLLVFCFMAWSVLFRHQFLEKFSDLKKAIVMSYIHLKL